MIRPSPAEFAEAATRGNLIPVYRELLADSDTPVSAYAKLGAEDFSFLLESVVGGEKWAAYSFIGVAPRAVLTVRNGRAVLSETNAAAGQSAAGGLKVTKEWDAPDPSAALKEILSAYRPVDIEGLPRFWGGAVGWLAYDVVRAFETIETVETVETESAPKNAAGNNDEIADVCVTLTDTLVIFDNLRQTIKVVAVAFVPDGADPTLAYNGAIGRVDDICQRLDRSDSAQLSALTPPPVGEKKTAALRFGGLAEPTSSFNRAEFIEAVGSAVEYILAGDVFQVVLAQRLLVPRRGVEPFDIYRALRVVNPSPYMFHLQFPEAQVTGASPETLVRCVDGRVEVRPIAGTRPRGANADQDSKLARELAEDAKECAEHLMLIDLGRNDVGRVAATGTVFVSQCMEVEYFSHVMHLVSHVHGDLREGADWHDVLRAAFPAGTLTGAPKIRAMQIVDELEPIRRGLYGGAVGYVSYTGNMDLAIAIRTLVTQGETISVGVGAGIVADSRPEDEYEETLNKARAVLRAVALAQGDS